MTRNRKTRARRAIKPLPGRIQAGIDVVSIAEVAQSVARFGDRYIRRVFTPREAAYCRSGAGNTMASRFAARVAAKEAVLKALRPDTAHIDWRSIEVWRHRSGSCDVVLHGETAALAARRGITQLVLSMTHDAGLAAAVVVAQSAAGTHQRER